MNRIVICGMCGKAMGISKQNVDSRITFRKCPRCRKEFTQPVRGTLEGDTNNIYIFSRSQVRIDEEK